MKRRTFIGALMASAAAFPALADTMSDALALVKKYAGKQETWDGPKAAAGKTIVVLAADMKNGGILGVTNGVQEAAKKIGWTVRVLDGAGSVSGRAAAFGQALALKPDGIIINGFDAVEQKAAMGQAHDAKVPMVSWHASPKIGPDPDAGVFANVSTDPMLVSQVAADWAYADAGGKPGVVIFTDSTYAIAIAKADRMKQEIEKLGGTVLEYVDTPIADTSNRMPTLTTALLQKYGPKWTHSLAINDIYFDFMGPALAAAGIAGDGKRLAGIVALEQADRLGRQPALIQQPAGLQVGDCADCLVARRGLLHCDLHGGEEEKEEKVRRRREGRGIATERGAFCAAGQGDRHVPG